MSQILWCWHVLDIMLGPVFSAGRLRLRLKKPEGIYGVAVRTFEVLVDSAATDNRGSYESRHPSRL
jgi:hypothetical protein